MVVEGLETKLGRLTSELGFELRQHAVALPILGTEGRAIGMLVLGVNVRRVLDDDYMYSPSLNLSSCYIILI